MSSSLGRFASPEDVLRHLPTRPGDTGYPYVTFHAPRFVHLLRTIGGLYPESAPRSIVDIGPGSQTVLVHSCFPDAKLTTIGYEDHLTDRLDGQAHLAYDLNNAYDVNTWPELAEVDLILLCEVIEHLYTSPVVVLDCLASWLRPGGHLVVQTPNAGALAKRLRFLRGDSMPWGGRGGFSGPGRNDEHFREYMPAELELAGRQAGLEIASFEIVNYFARASRAGRLYNSLSERLPHSLRQGCTVVYRRPLAA